MTVAGQTTFDEPVDVLNYALTLEHLEATFYREGLEQFEEEAFVDNNFAPAVREFLAEIRDHEEAHVETLTEVIQELGGEPVAEAEYDFSAAFADLPSFIQTAAVLENTGVAAYEGAAGFLIDEDELLTAALTIHSVEARHAGYLNGLTGAPFWPGAFDAPLPPEEVLAAVTPFIVAEAGGGAGEGDGSADSQEGDGAEEAEDEEA